MSAKTQDDEQGDWEDEGGASAPEPKQKTSKGLEIPVPKRKDVMDALGKVAPPPKKPKP
ncbi:MAG TPA: hypothetical protein VMK83_06755 [Gaiellaceae bacterium]|nr:hypothetical protein [Gaiellaceae bacterium]